MTSTRASHVPRAAPTDQIAFGLYLPGAELMLAASLHSVHENERQMLFQHLDLLTSGDVLLMDRGYPCRWLVALLNHRGIGFCMRVEKAGNAGFACVRDFLRSDLQEQTVTLSTPDKADAGAYECPVEPQPVAGLAVPLLSQVLPVTGTGRWRINQRFLKHLIKTQDHLGLSDPEVQIAIRARLAAIANREL